MERKLRPIYDAIDCGNLKLALKSITAVREVRHCSLVACYVRFWRDAASAQCCDHVRALRAVVLLRSGKVAEALAAAGEVASHTPTDEHVLKTLGVVWKATGRTAVRCHVRVTTATCSRSGLPRHCPCFPCLPRCRFSPVW